MSILDGRMRRRTYGLWLIAYLIVWGVITSMGVMQFASAYDPQAKVLDFGLMYQPRWAFVLMVSVTTAAFALAVTKRVRDCDWPSYLGYGFGVVSVLSGCFGLFVFDMFKIPISPQPSGSPAPFPFAFDTQQFVMLQLASLASMGCMILMLVLVFVRGTIGPNQHGADPSS